MCVYNAAEEKTDIATQEKKAVPSSGRPWYYIVAVSTYLSVVARRRLVQSHHGQWNE